MLSTLARGVLALLLSVAGLVLVTEAPAFACTCQAADVVQQTDRADAVFVGTVDEVREAGRLFEFDVSATHAYKGTVERQVSVSSAQQTTACGLGELSVGQDYLFLVTGAGPAYSATSCGGSGRATDARVAEIAAVLGVGQPIAAPLPPTASRTLVEDAPPATFGRLAAPGAALVLIGLLGLVVVRRLARRS